MIMRIHEALFGVGVLVAGVAHATTREPLVRLSADDRAHLARIVRQARIEVPQSFESADAVLRAWLAMPVDRRNEALLARQARALGTLGTPALIDMLSVGGLSIDVDDLLRERIEMALLDALGHDDDARARVVLRAAFETATSDGVRVVAARGLARTCDGRDLDLLLAGTRRPFVRYGAAIEGLGRCLRPEAAERLAMLANRSESASEAAPVLRAIGRLASDLVWSAPARRHDPAGIRIRRLAVESLVRAAARWDDDAATRALAMVRHPDTLTLLRQARLTAAPEDQSRLDRVTTRLTRSMER